MHLWDAFLVAVLITIMIILLVIGTCIIIDKVKEYRRRKDRG